MESLAKGRWVVALMVMALILCVIPAAPSHAGPRIKISAMQQAAEEFYGPNDGPAFLMISVEHIPDPTFESYDWEVPDGLTPNGSLKNNADDYGTRIILVNVGKFVAGDDISTTRFESPAAPIDVVLVDEYGMPVTDDITDHQATIVGSFKTLMGDPVAHLMTPIPQPDNELDPQYIPIPVQEAYFNASRMFTEAQYPSDGTEPRLPRFPTTVELAYFIYENQGGAGADFQDILDHIFQSHPRIPANPPGSQMRMRETTYTDPDSGEMFSVLEGEGEMFPHQPADGLLRYKFLVGKTGGLLKFDVVLPVGVDIKPGSSQNSVNLGSEGVLPVAILTRAREDGVITFNAKDEIDPDTIRAAVFDLFGFEILEDPDGPNGDGVSSIPIDKWTYEDVNGDGLLDLLVHFRTQALAGVVLTETDVVLDVRANTINNGMLVEGSDTIRVVPPNK